MADEFRGDGYSVTVFHDYPGQHSPACEETIDVYVRTDSGSGYSGVLATVRNLESLFRKFSKSGECANGTYVYIMNLVILEVITRETVSKVIADLVATGDIVHIFQAADA